MLCALKAVKSHNSVKNRSAVRYVYTDNRYAFAFRISISGGDLQVACSKSRFGIFRIPETEQYITAAEVTQTPCFGKTDFRSYTADNNAGICVS